MQLGISPKYHYRSTSARWRILPLLFFYLTLSYGQATLSGTVVDENNLPIVGASLTVREQATGPITGFALTTGKGKYTLNLSPDVDTLWLSLSHLSHASQEKIIVERPERLDWVLTAQIYELPEMVFRQPAVTRKGDTLVFDVSQLREIQDEHIEEVLARIPGITVETNGRILYQDLPISKFYIEGLDLLEGRYSLATRNLNVETIRDIEILEEHQPILALDSIVKPPNAAINLKLKSKVAITGELEGGTGISPALYLAEANVFGFQKQQQFNLLGSLNNIGEQQRDNFRSHYGELSYEQILVNPTMILQPLGVQGSNTLDNQERTAGINFLRKIGPHAQLKWQGFVAKDQLQYVGRNERILRDANKSVRFNELLNADKNLIQLNGQLIYELNKPKFYTRASLEAEKGNAKTEVNNLINGLSSLENLGSEKLILSGRWQAILRKGNKAYRIWSRVNFREEVFDFTLDPLDVFVDGAQLTRLENALQLVRERKLGSDTYTSYFLRHRQLRAQFKTGVQFRWHSIESNLSELIADGSLNTLGGNFQNDVNRILWAPYLDQNYTWHRENGQWKFNLPIALHKLTMQDELSPDQLNQTLLVFQPELEYVYNLSAGRSLTAKLSYKHDYNQEQLFYNNFLLRSNRQFTVQGFKVNQRDKYEFSLRYQGKSSKSALYYNSYLSLSATKADLISTTVFDSLGQSSLLASNSNVQQRARWQNRFEVVPWSSFQIKLVSHYSFFLRPSQLNNKELNIQVHQAWIEPYLAYTFGKSVISCRPRMDFYSTSISENSVWQAQLSWVFFHQFSKAWGNVKLDFNQYRTTIGERNVDNSLLNIRYKNKLPFWNLDVSLHLNNLTNASDFITFTQESFFEELSHFQLRPRQVILKLSRSF